MNARNGDDGGDDEPPRRDRPDGDDPWEHWGPEELTDALRRAMVAASPHLATAGREVLLAVKAFVDELVEPGDDQGPTRQHIPVE